MVYVYDANWPRHSRNAGDVLVDVAIEKENVTMPRYKLRTLLIVLAVGPMVLAGLWYAYRSISTKRDVFVPIESRLEAIQVRSNN
jgi:hypothetical protein